MTNIKFMWRALQHRNYRLFFGGQSLSMIGTWMTRIATSWLVYRLTDSAGASLMLGIVSFAGQSPTFFLAPIAGVWVDRMNRHRLLVVTQVISMLQSFGLAIVLCIPQNNHWIIAEILLLNILQGAVNAFDMTVRQAFVVDMIKNPEDLPNAIALNSSLVTAARLIGPSIAGVLIAAVGEFWCFLIDGISYLFVIAALLLMHVPKHVKKTSTARLRDELHAGFKYAFGFPPIRAILLQLSMISFTGMSYLVLMPIFSDRVQKNSPHVMGLLIAASGVGALSGALYMASRKSVRGLARVIIGCSLTLGFALMGFAYSSVLWISLVTMGLAGFGMMVEMAASMTILQTIVEEDMRGRLMSFYTMAFMGTAPLGSLYAGALANWLGAPFTVFTEGVICIAGTLFFIRELPSLREHIRPIYSRKGIIPVLEIEPPH